MMYTMPKNLLSICVNFTLATQLDCALCVVILDVSAALPYTLK